MLILGVETSCDETAAALVRDGRHVLSNVVASQHELHAEYAGVVPEIASRAHVEAILPVVRRALTDAGASLGDIDAVAVGHRPGLVGSLLVGLSAAKALAWSLDVPLIGVDHIHAHLYAGLLGDAVRDPDAMFPALGLAVSGGHTSLYALESPLSLSRLGATIDDAIGEAFDKAATILGLPHPGGPNLDRLASEPGADDHAHAFPIARLSRESLDLSFSGLKTSLLYAVRGHPGKGSHGPQRYERTADDLSDSRRRDLAASFQKAAVDAVLLKVGRALDQFEGAAGSPCRSLLTGGGVTANSRLRRSLAELGERRGLPVVLPDMRLCVDNAAMIAGLGFRLHASGRVSELSLAPVPTTAC